MHMGKGREHSTGRRADARAGEIEGPRGAGVGGASKGRRLKDLGANSTH